MRDQLDQTRKDIVIAKAAENAPAVLDKLETQIGRCDGVNRGSGGPDIRRIADIRSVPSDRRTVHLLMAYALLNCAISFVMFWFGYFRSKWVPSQRLGHEVAAVVLAKQDGSIRAEEAERWLFPAIVRERGYPLG